MLQSKSLVCDVDGTLFRSRSSPSFFPYFMLVSFEVGSIIRSLLLLLSYPLLQFCAYEIQLRIMIFVTFCGIKVKDAETVHRTVLPKFYLQELDAEIYEQFSLAKRRVVITNIPRVMVESFLKDYLSVDHVLGTELHVLGPYFTGFATKPEEARIQQYCELEKQNGMIYNAPPRYKNDKNHQSSIHPLPRKKYPKPLIFQDGRLSFLPTPSATLSMFMWLPFGVVLCLFRVFVGLFLPYKLGFLLLPFTGMRFRIINRSNKATEAVSFNSGGEISHHRSTQNNKAGGALYVCNHRTQLDPLAVSMYLGKPLTAVTYGLNRIFEIIAPLKTVRLTRDRIRDRETIQRLVSKGKHVVICPEGTTSREPYLFRFSPLFAELADEVIPVAITTEVDMFYCNTVIGTGGWFSISKGLLDPFFFLANPRPMYAGRILDRLNPQEVNCGGCNNGGMRTSINVANHVQREIAHVLRFECTKLTRKDKYMMLANNSGVVRGG